MKSWFASWLVVVFLAGSMLAQSTGSIVGTVTDSTHAAVPGAAVTATNVDTGVTRRTVTTDSGLYTVSNLLPGQYQLKVEKSGFASGQMQVTVFVGTGSTANLSLGVASVSEQVTVTSEAPMVNTTSSEVSGTMSTQEVQQLPVINRNFEGLATLVPGASTAPILDTSKANLGAGISIAGNEGRNLGLEIDGMPNRDYMLGGAAMDYTFEGIQEFKVHANDFGVQYGRSSGGVIEVATKSGTNNLHGSLFAFGRNDSMTAIDYFTQQAGLPKNSYDREDYGLSVGGPFIKDKLFFFGALERLQENFVEGEPTAQYQQMVILANALPSFGFVPAATMPKPIRNTDYQTRLDATLTPKHSFFARWAYQNDHLTNDQIGISEVSSALPPHPDLSSPNYTHHNVYSGVAGETWVIGPGSVNQFLFQASHYSMTIFANNSNVARNLQFPDFTTGGWISNLDFHQQVYELKDDFSHEAGNHSLKFGGAVELFPTFNIGANVLQQNWTIFTADPSVIVSNTAKYPQGFLTPGAAFLMFAGNLPPNLGTGLSTYNDSQPVGYKNFGFYAQDAWRITRDFTLNLGVRYDLTLNGFDQQQGANGRIYQALKAIGNPYGALPSTPTHDIQPRLGFAWNLKGNDKDVIRAGAGMYRDMAYLADEWQAIAFLKPTLLGMYTTYINLPFLPPALNPLSKYVLGNAATLPPSPPANLTQLPPNGGTTGSFVDPHATDPYTLQFNAGYTHEFTQNLNLSVDFTHVQGQHGWMIKDINPIEGSWDPNQGSIPTGQRRLASKFQSALGSGNILGAITDYTTSDRSRYDGLIINLQRRSRRVTLMATYTLSSAYAWGGISGGVANAATTPPYPENPDQPFAPYEWGPTNTDQRHRIVISGLFQLPAGFQLAPVLSAASALPYTLFSGSASNGTGDSTNRSFGDMYKNPATGQYVGINSQRGDATFDLDLRGTKSVRLGESRKLDLFAEIYNLTNRANFGNIYNPDALSPNFKQPSGYLAGFPTSRQLQLGARFIF